MRLGMIGLDTSHVTAFCKLLNTKKSKHTILLGYPGGSDLCSVSRDRVMKFTLAAGQYGVDIVEEMEEVAENSDAIFITSCDGRQHLEQFKQIAPFGKPVFIDKPFTCSLADAKTIIGLSDEHECPVFSASSLRYAKGIHGATKNERKNLKVAEVHGPVNILDDYPGWFWYGVHAAEILFELLGPGVKDVTVRTSGDLDVVQSMWSGDRVGIAIGYRSDSYHEWGGRTWTNNGFKNIIASEKPSFYELMMPFIIDFFESRKSPIEATEMVEIMAYLEAVNESMEIGETVHIDIGQ